MNSSWVMWPSPFASSLSKIASASRCTLFMSLKLTFTCTQPKSEEFFPWAQFPSVQDYLVKMNRARAAHVEVGELLELGVEFKNRTHLTLDDTRPQRTPNTENGQDGRAPLEISPSPFKSRHRKHSSMTSSTRFECRKLRAITNSRKSIDLLHDQIDLSATPRTSAQYCPLRIVREHAHPLPSVSNILKMVRERVELSEP